MMMEVSDEELQHEADGEAFEDELFSEAVNLSDKNRNVVCRCFKDDLGLDIIAQLELSMKWKTWNCWPSRR